MKLGGNKKQERKDKVWEQTQTCVQKYNKCLFVNADNVTSKQLCIMRKAFREIGAVLVMGKNVSDTPNLNTTFLDLDESRYQGNYRSRC